MIQAIVLALVLSCIVPCLQNILTINLTSLRMLHIYAFFFFFFFFEEKISLDKSLVF